MKSQEFEFGALNEPSARKWGVDIPGSANAWYNYPSPEELLNNLDDLKAIIDDFLSVQVPRLSILASYASGRNHGISKRPRRIESTKSDYRAKHNYGGFIATFNTSYLFGIPVKTETDDKAEQEEINRLNRENEADELNAQLGYDCARFGRAYEIHYRNRDDQDRFLLSSVFDTFLIYDDTLEHLPIAAVRLARSRSADGSKATITVYTDSEIVTFERSSLAHLQLRIKERMTNPYRRIPVVEWTNNRFRMGDYEGVLSQIDLYDSAQSDTANYMSDLNDAMLVIKGHLKEANVDIDSARKMKDSNIMLLEYGTGIDGRGLPLDAGYIYKQYDVSGTEAYKNRLNEDIHKFSLTPDFSDEHFAGNSSGEAMKYKLLGAEELRSQKERCFAKAIRQRYAIINALHQSLREPTITAENIRVEFTENLPVNYWEGVNNYLRAGGELSDQTLLGLLPWVGSYIDERERIESERAQGGLHDAHGDEKKKKDE